MWSLPAVQTRAGARTILNRSAPPARLRLLHSTRRRARPRSRQWRPRGSCSDVLDGFVGRRRAPIRPSAGLIADQGRVKLGIDLFWRIAGSPGAIEGQRYNVDPFLEIARRGFDLEQLLADMVDDAFGAVARAKSAQRKNALA